MSNLATLKPFKKGKDPRRHKRQKGEISVFKVFKEDYIAYLKDSKIDPKKARNALMKRLDRLSKKNPKALELILDRVYGKVKEEIKIEGELPVRVIKVKKYEPKKSS